MRKTVTILLCMMLSVSVIAQQKIQLRSADKAECMKSDMTSLRASFSFSTIEARDIQSERGMFSELSLPNTVIGGNEGDPQIPVINELIAVPVGATPRIEITSYSTTEYNLENYGIHTLVPRQPDVFKNQDPKDVPFVYNEAAYQSTRGFRSEPQAIVSVNGTMRGVQVGQISIEPVSYDPVNNKIRVFNNIEVEVHFDGADALATEDLLVKTYSPYFDVLYKQLFNGRAVLDLYDEHPDLWKTPVKMLVIANRMFENCIQDWLAWKTTKGIYVDVQYTDVIGTSADAIKSFIQNKYSQNAPTFLVIMGDQDQVAPSVTSASNTNRVSDLYYSSIDGDEFVDMFHSRFSATTTSEMTSILNKGMEYEQYTMPDPSYLNNTLLIAGEDSGWGITVGRPTIWYATNYYYNTEHGFSNVYEFSHGTYTNCYSYLSSGVGFANYTAHGSQTSWAGPSFSVSDVNNLTNAHKYFLAIGNCCQSGDWGYGTCFGEALTRAENKGAYAYIGSCPNTTWKNDYYFGVGATNRADGTMPTMEETGLGIYDAIWMDDMYNTVNSILYVGLLAGNAAQAAGYELHSATLYYWQAYHVLGDGSIMPYRVQPTANDVSHMTIFPMGMNTYEVSAVPGSYVSITKDGAILGTALIGATGTVQVPVTPVTTSGDVTICVTAPQRIPYIATVTAAALDGAYISVDSYTPEAVHVGDDTDLSLTFKNVGTAATTGTTTVTLTAGDSNAVILTNTKTFGALAADATTTVSGFRFHINSGVVDGTIVPLHYKAVNGSDIWEGDIAITATEAVLEFQDMSWDGGFTSGETLTVTAMFKNKGHYKATNAVAAMTSNSGYITINNSPITIGDIAVDEVVSCQFNVTIAASCPETAQIPVTFTMTADGGLTAQGTKILKNACNVYFVLVDSRNDGWDGNATLKVSFDDDTPEQNLTLATGESPKTIPMEIGNGTHVTLTWVKGTYDGECSFTVGYEGNLIIYEMAQGTNPNSGVLYEFDCNCAAASQTFTVDVVSSNADHGTVSGGGEYSYGESCTVTATPADGYMFTSWTQDGEVVSNDNEYTFIVHSDISLVANFGEGTMIGDGGDATDQYLPSYSYYNNSLTQQIYTVEELGGAGLITSISFYNGGAEKTRAYDFYMKATDKNTFSGSSDWVVVSEEDKVFSGDVTMTAGVWTIITLDPPYIYDGVSNMVLVTDDNTGSWSSGMKCRVFDAESQSIRVYDDNINFDPSAPANYNGTVMNVKNQLIITKEELSGCVRPTHLTATNIGPDFVELSWAENGDSEHWYVVYNGDFETADTNEGFVLEGLEPATQYTIMVRPDCDENLFSNTIVIKTLDACPVPQNVEVSDITGNAATVSWDGYNDRYIVQLGYPNTAAIINETFDEGIPADWTNDAAHAWTVEDGYMKSGNAGVTNSTSSISVTVNCPVDGTISFDFWSRGEGNDSNDWDNSRFYIDDEMMFRYAAHADWESFSAEITAGVHTFKWVYKKDSSVDPDGDYFAVDNIIVNSGEIVWNDLEAVDDTRYTFRGLEPLTTYCVRVQGVCGATETGWSEPVVFTTTETATVTQEVAMMAGWNWFSSSVEITLQDLQNALVNALPGTSIMIKGKDNNTLYNPDNNRWTGRLTSLEAGQMYEIKAAAACSIVLEGTPLSTTGCSVTIKNGANWIAYPLDESMTLTDAFAGFAVNGDIIKSKYGTATYTRGKWMGTTLTTLEPGQGYIYKSSSTEDRTLTFPNSKK